MFSVTQRIQMVKQPYSGYLPIKNFEVIHLQSFNDLAEGETLAPQLVGIVVDYLTRFMSGNSLEAAFMISLKGAAMVGESSNASKLIKKISQLDDESIISACKLAGYDSAFRAGVAAYKDVKTINPTPIDISNIRKMVERSLKFFEEYGPVLKNGLTFEGAYTSIVSSGDGDYLTSDSLLDFKVSVKKPTSKHTLQLLMYYIMGMHSIHSADYKNLKYLEIYNPRLNDIFRFPTSEISEEIIKEVSEKIIGYGNKQSGFDDDTFLTVKDVALRYRVSENKIRGDCFSLGLPHFKKGNKYVISELALIEWEARQVYIPVGRSEKRLLPGYLALIGMLSEELKRAKQEGDHQKVKKLRKELKLHKSRNPNRINYFAVFISAILFVILCIVIYEVLSYAL